MDKTLRDTIAEHLALLLEIGSDESGILADRLEQLARDIDKLLAKQPPGRGMGRHSRATERLKQRDVELHCYLNVEFLRQDGLSWVDAYEKAGEWLHLAPETVRKAHARFAKLV